MKHIIKGGEPREVFISHLSKAEVRQASERNRQVTHRPSFWQILKQYFRPLKVEKSASNINP